MNKITGKITLTSSNTGIPNLLVVVYDIDPGARPEELITGLSSTSISRSTTRTSNKSKQVSPKNELGLLGDRIGSVLTGTDGSFLIEYEDAEFQIRNPNEKRPDIFLMVFAPDRMGVSLLDSLLFYSPEIRQDAGRIESYFIQIPEEKINDAGLQASLASVAGNAKANFSTMQFSRKQSKSITKEFIDSEKETRKLVKKVISDNMWSSFFNLKGRPDRKRASIDQIQKLNANNVAKINKGVFSNKKAKGNTILIQIPDNEYENLRKAKLADQSKILEKYMMPFDKIAGEGALYMNDYLTSLLPKEKKELIDNLTKEINTKSDVQNDNGKSDNKIDDGVAKKMESHVNSLIDSLKSPEDLMEELYHDASTLKSPNRPNGDTVNENIKKLEFKGGPADVPAFYDFNSLHIAFPHVWQELVDNDIIQLTDELLAQLAENGVDITNINIEDDLDYAITEKVKNLDNIRNLVNIHTKGRNSFATATHKYGFLNDSSNQVGAGGVDQSTERSDDKPPKSEAGLLLADLKSLLLEKNKFTVFKEGIINFGIMVTYRQKWTPLNYQVGDLVRSIPLAPKEVRKINIKKVIKKDNVVKTMENNLQSSQNESNETGRTEKEIVDKAQRSNSFGLNAKANTSYNGLVWKASGDISTDFKTDSSKSSDAAKKELRESVKKAAQEFKDERKLEIETKESFESEYNESSEISNPNDELTVTYLFYELQRRFEVSEKLYKVTPVVLVPMNMPSPTSKEMNALLLKYTWIINRVLLDDRFRPALEYLNSGMEGEESKIKQINIEINAKYNEINLMSGRAAHARSDYEYYRKHFASGDLADHKALLETVKQQMQDAYDTEQKLLNQIYAIEADITRLRSELNQANLARDAKLFELNLLRLHVKENIFYYMQAIWDYTYKDNIFMTFYDDQVPIIVANQKVYTYMDVPKTDIPPSIFPKPGHTTIEVAVKYELGIPTSNEMQTLIEIADLDKPLGYKGNYMIFPMRQSNAVTEYMMTPFLDDELGLRDPDGWGQWTPDDFVDFVNHLRQTKTAEEFRQMEQALKEQYARILDAPRRLTEEIVVPSDSLYIEALPGAHPLLEDFKLKHRIMDVQKVQAEVRKMELENLRYAARILESQLDDPDTDKKIIVEGNPKTIINSEE